MTTEAQFQRAVIALAKTCGWKCQHSRKAQVRPGVWATPISGDVGFPDLVLVRDRVMFVELKTDRGLLEPEQVRWRDALQGAGADWRCWRPRMMPEVAEVLQRGQ